MSRNRPPHTAHSALESGLHAEKGPDRIEQDHRWQFEGRERQHQIAPSEQGETEPPRAFGAVAANDANDRKAEHPARQEERHARPGREAFRNAARTTATTKMAPISPAIGKRTVG